MSGLSGGLWLWLVVALLAVGACGGEEPRAPWQQPYAGEEAAGEHVLAFWRFEPGAETRDSSGKGHDLTLRGQARVVPDGRFGAALESLAAGPENDKPQGAVTAKKADALSPQGAFTLELWLRPKPQMAEQAEAFLLDNKYYHYARDLPQANAGYVFRLRRAAGGWQPVVMLGYGKDSEEFTGRAVELPADAWHHLAFTYDGQGMGRILLGGKDIGGATYPSRGAIAPAHYALAVGDRYGSIHHGCAAFLDEVRICRGVRLGGLSITIGTRDGRASFRRMEKAGPLQVRLTNHTDQTLTGGTALVSFEGAGAALPHKLPDLKPRQSHVIEVALDTSLRPGRYELAVAASAEARGRKLAAEHAQAIAIVPRPLPHQMPVVMWGGGDFERLKEIGFTHHIQHVADYQHVWEAGAAIGADRFANAAGIREMLDLHLAEGIGVVTSIGPGRWVERDAKYRRVDRAGKPLEKRNACVAFPEVQQFGLNVGRSIAESFGHFPALQAALIHTEIRDHTWLCFHEHDKAAFEKHAGFPIPREVAGKTGPHYSSLPSFPADRVIPDDFPLLVFYRWFWKDGDGWNPLHTQVHKGLHATGRDDLWTFFDPAVRAPSLWGSGGAVDVLSQWTYCYPDPLKIGQATDELFAMAEGRPGQQVMKMTQVIWYRRQTAPELPKDESRRAPWEREIPDARFITIAPDHLREALWCKLARPVRGIMYHGWGSLVAAQHGSYCFTNPETAKVLKELVATVVRPLGPTLLQVPDREADVAVLESFASQMLASRGTWGWSGSWEADAHLILQWAQLQPRIVFEETILRDGLDGVRVLVLPYCDVLPESVAAKIASFQRKGGILVADEFLAPRLNPDILLPSYKRTGKADEDKAALQARAAALRRELDTVCTRYAESDSPDVVVRCRACGSADYLFAINDRRTFGAYVGHHGKVMEKGLPSAAAFSVRRPEAHVYDLVAHKPVPVERRDGGVAFRADFGPGEGRLFLLAPRPIAELRLDAPAEARLGGKVALSISVLDGRGAPLAAVVPVHLEVLDPEGRPAELSGHYGACNGRLAVTLDLAPNDLPGEWTLRAAELASGLIRQHRLAVRR